MKSLNSVLPLVVLVAATLGCGHKGPGNKIDVSPLGDHAEVYVRALSTAPQYQEKIGTLQTVTLIESSDSQNHYNFTNTTKRSQNRKFRLEGTKGAMDVELKLNATNSRPWVIESMEVTDATATAEATNSPANP